ncbi:DUF2202 domain-containing protein [Candidatus Kaiserbacteria bacterium]|nr:MAG: DUF2202 domain-containing protein [Candidatus Kaiserbacteria bacterium]
MNNKYSVLSEDAGEDDTSLQRLAIPTDTSTLTEDETAGLIKMREEEKLARDVYQALDETWSVPIFKNIAVSESRHTEAVKSLLSAHRVADPVTDDTRGVFQNAELAKLYTELVARGSASVVEAYKVGAYIEDLDIADLKKEIASVTHEDIRVVYEYLQSGSENHMRAFNRNIEIVTGETYIPSFISKDTLEIILDSENSMKGMSRGDGSRQGMHDGSGHGKAQGNGRNR